MLSEGFLTEYEYHNFESFDSHIYQEESHFGPKVSAGIFQSEPQKYYKLRSSPKKVSQIPKKKIDSPTKKLPNQTQERRQNHGDQTKAAEIEEVTKNVQTFNFENELCKIKIQVPLTELMKNPCYRNPVLKMINSHANKMPSNTVNLQ